MKAIEILRHKPLYNNIGQVKNKYIDEAIKELEDLQDDYNGLCNMYSQLKKESKEYIHITTPDVRIIQDNYNNVIKEDEKETQKIVKETTWTKWQQVFNDLKFFFDVKNLEEAIYWVKRCPDAIGMGEGEIELRQVF